MPLKPVRPFRRHRPTTEALENRLLLATQVFTANDSMNIFEDFNPPTPPAQNYPSDIVVDGVVGTVTELRVGLRGVYHTRPADLDVLLVSPAGKSILLMSDAGGTADIADFPPLNLSFADAATKDLPQNTLITGGTYRPTNYDTDDFFRETELANAPTHNNLAALAADNPNGMWLLYVVDDTIGDVGGVQFGWTLTFVTNGPGPAAPTPPDLVTSNDRGVSNQDNITNLDSPVFNGTATGATQVRLFVDGQANNSGTVGANGTYQFAIGGLLDGVHAISARALNADGTEGPMSGELIVTIDTLIPENPSVPDLTPESDTGASNTDNDTTDTTPTFTGEAVGADSVTLIARLAGTDSVVGTGTVVNGTYTVTPTAPLAPGTYDFLALGSDIAGNVSFVNDPGLTVIIRPGGTVTPKVTATYVRGTGWAAPFKNYLASHGLGDATYGYQLGGATTLPWINVDEIVLRYDANLTAAPTSVVVDGVRQDYAVTSQLVDPRTVRLVLPRPLGNAPDGSNDGDRIRLTVPGAGVGGGAYTLDFTVLQGDVNNTGSVLADDFSAVKKKFFKDTTDTTTGDASYSAFHDVDGSGVILAIDFSEVKKRFFDSLPAAGAPAAAFSANRITEQVLA